MIEIKVSYWKRTYNSGREKFYYNYISVKGHSSDGTLNSIKCCAGVTAITTGVLAMFDVDDCDIKLNKGFFELITKKSSSDDVHRTVNTLVYQLANIATIYPEYFKEFNFIEEKLNNGQEE